MHWLGRDSLAVTLKVFASCVKVFVLPTVSTGRLKARPDLRDPPKINETLIRGKCQYVRETQRGTLLATLLG